MKFMQKVRGAIDALWPTVLVKGRGWGIKGNDNPHPGDTIFLNHGCEVVIISEAEGTGDASNQTAVVRQFKQVSINALGALVIAALEVNRVKVISSPSVVFKIRIEIVTRKATTGGYEVVANAIKLSDSGEDEDSIPLSSKGSVTPFMTERVAKKAATAIMFALDTAFDLFGAEVVVDRDSLIMEISI